MHSIYHEPSVILMFVIFMYLIIYNTIILYSILVGIIRYRINLLDEKLILLLQVLYQKSIA